MLKDLQHLGPEWLKLRLVSGDCVTVARSEILPVLRHRLSLFFFTAVICLLTLLNLHGDGRNMLFWQDAIFYVTLKVGSLLLVVLTLSILRKLGGNAQTMTVHLSFLTCIIAAGMVAASDLAFRYKGGVALGSVGLFVALFFLYWVIIEVEALIYCTLVVPRILQDLRDGTPTPPAAPARTTQAVEIGHLSIDPATISHVRAEGNYVDIRTDTDRHYLLATFSTVVTALDGQDGQQIHRSHWIAARVLKGFYRDGRDIIVVLEDGTEIAVAQSRQKELLPWLQAVTVRL